MERLRRMVTAGLILFSGTLMVLLVREMSADALAVLIGVGCGMLASLPLGIAALVWSGRGSEARGREVQPPREAAPPVIIVTAGAPAGQMPAPWPPSRAWMPLPRGFAEPSRTAGPRVVGEPMEEGLAIRGQTKGPWTWEGGDEW